MYLSFSSFVWHIRHIIDGFDRIDDVFSQQKLAKSCSVHENEISFKY